VRPGENLTAIARRYGVSAGELARLNQLADPNHLLVGTRLRLPASVGSGTASSTPIKVQAGTAQGRSPSFTLSDDARRQTASLLDRAAREFGVPPALLKALTYTESRWRQDVVSGQGAIGVGQLLPETAAWLASMMREPGLDPRSTSDNIRMSARLLRYLLDATGSTREALASYYQGIGAVLRVGVSPGGARYGAVVAGRQAWFA
jgi:N-acetylmuramoyl-L-alanine amidase